MQRPPNRMLLRDLFRLCECRRRLRTVAQRAADFIQHHAVYASLLSPGSYLELANDITPNSRFIVGQGYNAATGRREAYLLDMLCIGHNGDVDNNGCVDDADLLAVLFAFGNTGEVLGRADVNCDGTIDDADLLQVLFNFGSGC